MYMQYMGENPHYKVFVNVVDTWVKVPCGVKSPYGERVLLKGARGLHGSLAPIHPSDFEEYLTMDACAFVYRVRQYGEIFIADEEHRDSHYHHLPGYLFIKDIQPGTIIPVYGIVTEEFLSDADKDCIADPKKIREYRKQSLK